MDDEQIDTVRMHHCVKRWQQGEREAADEVLRAVGNRLEHLARRMLKGFSTLRRHADTADVLQGSSMRLLNTLRNIQPLSTRDFFNLAAVNIRRELLDLSRRFGRRTSTELLAENASPDGAALEHPDPYVEPGDSLELWSFFHEMVDKLPAEEREVVSLAFYHGWTQAQMAELFDVDRRTIQRRWQSACQSLNRLIGDRLPQVLGSVG